MKKEIYHGVEYHFPETFKSAEVFLLTQASFDMSEEALLDMAWDDVRQKRDKLISVTDYTQVNDSPLSEELKEEYKVYRQALRDITDSPDPNNIVWPDKPSS